MKHGRGFAQTVQTQVQTQVLAVQTMSEALNLEAAMLGVWLGVHSVCTRSRAGAGGEC